MNELIQIQQKLKAPKNQKNEFGNYFYRNCEDILEAVKPLLVELGCMLTINDELVNIGERYYIKATATISKDDKSVSVSAYARESLEKKGMDSSQITGATSSYARKYALNGLFLIDDTKDADSMNNAPVRRSNTSKTNGNTQGVPSPTSGKLATEKQLNYVRKLAEFNNVDVEAKKPLSEWTGYEASKFIEKYKSDKEVKSPARELYKDETAEIDGFDIDSVAIN